MKAYIREYRPSINISNYGSGPFSKSNLYHVNAAALNRLGEWFDFLKSNNVYNNTRIIIAADHGAGFVFEKEVPGLPFIVEQYNPLFLVKDFNRSGSLKTDTTFMTNADVPAIAFAEQIENPVNPFTGKPVTTDDKSRPLLVSIEGSIHINTANEAVSEGDYYVHGNIFDAANWTKAGQ